MWAREKGKGTKRVVDHTRIDAESNHCVDTNVWEAEATLAPCLTPIRLEAKRHATSRIALHPQARSQGAMYAVKGVSKVAAVSYTGASFRRMQPNRHEPKSAGSKDRDRKYRETRKDDSPPS